MTTTKSSSEAPTRAFTLYSTSLKGQIPFMLVAAILFFVSVPLVFYVNTYPLLTQHTTFGRWAFPAGVFTSEGHAGFLLFCLIALAFIQALLQNGYLHNKKATDMYHSIPLRRSQLLGVNLLAGLTAVLLPYLLICLLTMISQLVLFSRFILSFVDYFSYIAQDLFCAAAAVAVVLVFVSLIAVNVGTGFDCLAVALLTGFMPMGIYLVVMAFGQMMIYGFTFDGDYILLLSPFTFAFQRFTSHSLLKNIGYTALWLVLGAALLLLTVHLYNRRKNELAEQPRPEGVLQTVAKCFAAFCGGVIMVGLFHDVGLTGWILAILVGALLAGVVAELILSRGIHALKKNLKWILGAGGVSVLLLLGAHLDIFGYADRVPQAANVQASTVNYTGSLGVDYTNVTLSDPACLEIITEAHRLITENPPPADYVDWETYSHRSFNVSYKQSTGIMERQFYPVYAQAWRKLAELEGQKEFIRKSSPLFILGEPGSGFELGSISLLDAWGGNEHSISLSQADSARLVEAVRADMLAAPLEERLSPSGAGRGYIRFHLINKDVTVTSYESSDRYGGLEYTVLIPAYYSNTLTLLGQLGLVESLQPTAEVTRIVLLSTEYIDYFDSDITDRVVTAREDIIYYGGEAESCSDPDTIKTLMAAARNQMYLSGNEAMLLRYYAGDTPVGQQLVLREHIPPGIKTEPVAESEFSYYYQYSFEDGELAETAVIGW